MVCGRAHTIQRYIDGVYNLYSNCMGYPVTGDTGIQKMDDLLFDTYVISCVGWINNPSSELYAGRFFQAIDRFHSVWDAILSDPRKLRATIVVIYVVWKF